MATVRYTNIEGQIVAEKRAVRKTYVSDRSGSTISLIGEEQLETDMFSYWPYGTLRSRTGVTPTPFMFKGEKGSFTDRSTTIYVRARYLLPMYARWATKDPLFDAWTYDFTGNSPTTMFDYSGLRREPPNSPKPPPLSVPWQSTYGHFCGIELGKRAPGVHPIDPLDKCCKAHDVCYYKNRCPHPMASWVKKSAACQKCDPDFCDCMKKVKCKSFLCESAKSVANLQFCMVGTSMMWCPSAR